MLLKEHELVFHTFKALQIILLLMIIDYLRNFKITSMINIFTDLLVGFSKRWKP